MNMNNSYPPEVRMMAQQRPQMNGPGTSGDFSSNSCSLPNANYSMQMNSQNVPHPAGAPSHSYQNSGGAGYQQQQQSMPIQSMHFTQQGTGQPMGMPQGPMGMNPLSVVGNGLAGMSMNMNMFNNPGGPGAGGSIGDVGPIGHQIGNPMARMNPEMAQPHFMATQNSNMGTFPGPVSGQASTGVDWEPVEGLASFLEDLEST